MPGRNPPCSISGLVRILALSRIQAFSGGVAVVGAGHEAGKSRWRANAADRGERFGGIEEKCVPGVIGSATASAIGI